VAFIGSSVVGDATTNAPSPCMRRPSISTGLLFRHGSTSLHWVCTRHRSTGTRSPMPSTDQDGRITTAVSPVMQVAQVPGTEAEPPERDGPRVPQLFAQELHGVGTRLAIAT
jgi:hypothetical protein